MIRHRYASVVFGCCLAVGLLLTAAITPARADHVEFTLEDLIKNQIAVQVCDKIFSNFRDYFSIGIGGASLANPANIRALFLHDDCLNPGIQWSASSTGGSEWQVSSSQSQQTTWRYDVTAGPGFLIKDNDLRFAGFVSSSGGRIDISETARDLDGNLVAEKSLFFTLDERKSSDHRDFPGQQALSISMDISLTGGDNGGAELAGPEQRFSQQVVPEPGSLTLVVLGTAGLIGYRWRRQGKV